MRNITILLTGASEGIGRALALKLAAQGAQLALAARSKDKLDAVARECQALGAKALAIPSDIADQQACKALVEQTIAHFGHLDILINNAGITMNERFEHIQDFSIFERIMRVNYFGPLYCTSYALPTLKQRKGLIVTISSWQGKTGFPRSSGYAASKHAVQGFFDSLRIELAGSGVDVLMVSPGPVDTTIHTKKFAEPGQAADITPRIRRSDLMMVDECAQQILRAISRRDRELVMTPKGKLLVWARLIAPAFLDRIVSRSVERFYNP